MRVQDIGTAIAKRYWIVIALVLIATLTAAIVAQVQSPVYKVEIAVSATAPINPTTKQPDSTAMLGLAASTPSIANFTESVSVANAVSARLAQTGIDISPEELLKKVSSVPEANSASIKITFTDGSPTRVAEIANAWGETLVLMSTSDTELFSQEFKNLILNGSIVFTNRAIPPEKPTMPKTFAYIGLGFFAGLLLGLLVAILIEYFDPHFRSAREVEETLDIPVLSTLPKHKGSRATALLPSFGEGSRTWKAYAELRSSLILSPEGAPKSILAAPAIPFEAGSAVAANLAVSIANTGRRTLLIDCDLTERSLSKLMQAEGRPGLSDALAKEEDYRGKTVEGKAANLSFLPAGKKSDNSTDLLSLPAFEEELREQEGIYDEVVLYAPPLIDSMDAAVVASQAEASLILIDADRCTRKAALEAMNSYERLGIIPLGAVLANVKMKGRDAAAPEREKKTAPATKKIAPEEAVKKKKKDRKERKPAPPTIVGETAKTTAGPIGAGITTGSTRPPEKPVTIKPPARQADVKPAPAEPVKPEPSPKPVEAAPAPAETLKPEAAPEPAEAEPAPSKWYKAGVAARRPNAAESSWGSAPAVTPGGGAAEDLQQVRDSVAEDFRRMGEKGDPIPKNWLRALNSDKADVRESAAAAITVYYQSFLKRYRISDESIERITASIIRMMRREDEFAGMSEEEAQRHLRQMLIDAGARFSGSDAPGGAPQQEQPGMETKPAPEKKDEKEIRRQEKKRFRLDGKSEKKGTKRGKAEAGDEEGVDWE
ncbi:MAG: hypothetical protein JW854_00280 [Actinobacteria bacterium]|nr:hypothetical protein [Actinomycetota bacterium]